MKTVIFAAIFSLSSAALATERAADGDEVVMRRLFTKTGTFEVEVGAGVVLNPTFVDTQLATATLRYHRSEAWGLGIRAAVASTKDRRERQCVETFYNDPAHKADAPCASQDGGRGLANEGVNLGPAYAPIRELKGMIAATADYTVAYGKQILLYGATNHFDMRIRFGAGVLASNDYAERQNVRGRDRPSRGDPAQSGVAPDESDGDGRLWGEEGRPAAQAVMSPVAFFGVVEEYHMLRRFFVAGELSGYLASGIGGGIDPFLVAQISLGVRL